MVQEYVNKLIENLPDDIKNVKTPIIIDLVLDGGAFNGSYLVGALYFLKEMEIRGYVKVDRISGCSIGSLVAFLYFMNELDQIPQLYDKLRNHFKKYHNLKLIKNIKTMLKCNIPENICEKINNKLFICYNNIQKRKKIVKSCYTNVDEIFETIIKSSFVPYLIDGNCLYKNKYIDGINPFIFNKEGGKKILHLDLYGYDKIYGIINIQNEQTNFHRILSGLLDIHSFFIKKSDTQMCRYINERKVTNIVSYFIRSLIENIIIYAACIFTFIQANISKNQKDTFFFKIITKMLQDFFVLTIETYCV